MCEPKFKAGNKAEYKGSGDWVPVRIQSPPLRWAAPSNYHGYVYLVRRASDQHIHVAHEENLRRAEQWEACPGKHRVHAEGALPGTSVYGNMERLVE